MLNDDELDLEDLEARLYSQIFHSNAEEVEAEIDPLPVKVQHPLPDDMRPPNRYFQHRGNRSGNKYSKKNFNKTNPYVPWTSNKSPSQSSFSSGNYEKSNQQQQRYPVDQVVVVSPCSNVACVANFKQKSKNRKAKWKQNKIRERIISSKVNPPPVNTPPKVTTSTVTTPTKVNTSTVNPRVKSNTHTRFRDVEEDEQEIIVLSDSDDEDSEVLSKGWSVVTVDSDEENKLKVQAEVDVANKIAAELTKSINDDVIFIEPAPVEVISLDEDNEPVAGKSTQSSDHQKVLDSETSSVGSSNCSGSGNSFDTTPKKPSPQKCLTKELYLSTPESSASNDFMDNSGIELRDNFNFSLHGSDFHEGSEFVRPTKPVDTETESTSSTIDINTLKASVFSEIEFPRGEDMFSEANLESFGNSITPVRHLVNKEIVKPSIPKQAEMNLNVYSSESSSESDFDEPANCQQKKQSERVRNLPDLSHMPTETRPTLLKRAKKPFNLNSKFDLIENNQNLSDAETSKSKEKCKKRKSDSLIGKIANKKKGQKNKKRKSLTATAVETPEVPETTNIETPQEFSAEDILKSPKDVTESDPNIAQEAPEIHENFSLTKEFPVDCQIDEAPITELPVKTEMDQLVIKSDEKTDLVLKNSVESVENRSFISLDADDDQYDEFEESENQLKDLIVIDETFNSELDDTAIEILSEPEIEPEDIQLVNCATPLCQDIKSRLGPISKENPVNLQNASVDEVQESMSSDPNLWQISQMDRFQLRASPKGRRCNRCRQFGHMARKCPNKIGPLKCNLCGNPGHLEPRCPNRICTQCGKRSQFSTTYCRSCFKFRNHQCKLCGMLGHCKDNCPDLWRRYHLTTEEGPLVMQEGPLLKPDNNLWCSGCAKSGHLEYTCTYYNSAYPPADPNIRSYDDIYGSGNVGVSRGEQRQPQKITKSPRIQRQRQQKNVQPPMRHEPNQGNFRTPNREMNEIFLRERYMQEQTLMNSLNWPNYLAPGAESYTPNNVYLPNAIMPYMGDQQFVVAQNNIIHNRYQFEPNTFETNFNSNNLNTNLNNSREFFFEDNLPNYISFDSNAPVIESCDQPVPQVERESRRDKKLAARKLNKLQVFLKQPVLNIQQFLSCEFRKLAKMSCNSPRILKKLKRTFHSHGSQSVLTYHKELNMVLFGIYFLREGRLHLDKLKHFKTINPASKLTISKRRSLYDSYCYIFGVQKHVGVDYKQLLQTV